ncbi:PAS domain-containing protein [Pseudomonas sp. R2.Fl]|nr:PAS domain-containing protein [Pseudomonas sp. R2.Fl]
MEQSRRGVKPKVRMNGQPMEQRIQDQGLLALFEAFSLKCRQLQQAIRLGDDRLVRLLDRELEPLIGAVIDYRARCPHEVHQQLRFINSLIREDADDRSCVLKHSAMLSVLLERYFSAGDVPAEPMTVSIDEAVTLPSDDIFLNETVLNCLPDLVSVVTLDYRYLYCNLAHAEHFRLTQFDVVGCHVSELFGTAWFEIAARLSFDLCFAGKAADLLLWNGGAGRAGLECRLSPLTGHGGETIGAVMMARPIPANESGLAA